MTLTTYLKTAARSLSKNKPSAIINILGLSTGMAAAMLIGLWIYNELSFNTSHKNYDHIARVTANIDFGDKIYTIESQPMPLATELRTDYNHYFKYVVISTQEQHIFSIQDKTFTQTGNFMQPEAPDMLTLNMLKGTRSGLTQPSSILLSESVSKKLFGSQDPIDKIITIDNKLSVKITGVYQDFPDNSDFKNITFIAPFDFYLSSYDWAQKKYTDWNNRSVQIFTQLNPNITTVQASTAISKILANHTNNPKQKPQLFLQPMAKWHLYSQFENGINVTSTQLRFVWFYGIIGGFILLLACINFMNLSTARSEKRAKEVGVRKTMGSARIQLIQQFFIESILLTSISFTISLALVELALPWFNILADKQIKIPYQLPVFWLASATFTLLTGILAGSYPALYLSSFDPVKVLKGTFRTGRLASLPRQALVTLQLTVSIALVIGTITIFRQIQFAKARPLGYTQTNLLQTAFSSPEFENKYALFRNELKNSGAAIEVSASASPVTSIWSTSTGFTWQAAQNTANTTQTASIEFSTIAVTPQYGSTVGWQFTKGRDFHEDLASDSTGFVLNEAAAKLMGLSNPVGTPIDWEAIKNRHFKVLGVVKDMVMESPFNTASPTIFFIYPKDGMNSLQIRLNPSLSASSALKKVEDVFKKLAPSTPFEYAFVNDEFNKKFAAEQRTGDLSWIFATLAIFISCLGLFGMASYIAEQRTKEIGVRKVLGASVLNLWILLCKDFTVLVIISLFIAFPIAYYYMHNWLASYAVRTDLPWWLFVATATGALGITLATVSYQSIKAALANPVKSLKQE
ncbi:MAG: ABC transporter permease [Bacteroidetes bacterium]|nr:ABC transporter permease [Bacteroidota bacterium]